MTADVEPNSELFSRTIKLKFETKESNTVCHLHNLPPLNNRVMRFPNTKLMSIKFSLHAVSKRQNSDGHVLHIKLHFAWSPVSHEADKTNGSKAGIRAAIVMN
jgi:hypothetical protein